MNNENPNWEKDAIVKLAQSALDEQKKSRQWKIFFRLVWLLIIGIVLYGIMSDPDADSAATPDKTHTAVIKIGGEINEDNDVANLIREGLKAAYKDKGTKGVIIETNSGGGSPVISNEAYDEIRYQKAKHPNIPVYTVVDDICASGCYYLASASDKIFASPASIVGSIGVISPGFGYTGIMQKLGIENRTQTSGVDKAFGSPFGPITPEQVKMKQEMLDAIHQQFIAAVKQGRGKRLQNNPNLFTGRVWVGTQALPLGLIDGLGSTQSIARDQIKSEKLVDYTPNEKFGKRLSKIIGTEVNQQISTFFRSFNLQ